LVEGLVILRVVVAAITAISGREESWFECSFLPFFLSGVKCEQCKEMW